MLIAGTDVPVVPCYIRGGFEAWPPNRRWPRMRRVSVWIGEPLFFGQQGQDKQGWNTVTVNVESAVRALAESAAA